MSKFRPENRQYMQIVIESLLPKTSKSSVNKSVANQWNKQLSTIIYFFLEWSDSNLFWFFFLLGNTKHIENMSSIVHKKKKSHSSKSGYSANNTANSTIIHCNGKSSSKKLYHKNDELSLHPQSQHHQRYKSASAASTGTRILHKRHNIVR